mgnify:CR=1 FL=1
MTVPAGAGPSQGIVSWAVPEYAGKIELAENFARLSNAVPPHINRVAAFTTTKIDCDYWPVDGHRAYRVSKGLSDVPRRSPHLDVNLLGFAWVQDVVEEL